MKLVIIYGPPASGKLTVAEELSKITNYKIFHNHLTVDLVKSSIDPANKNFWNYVNKFRYDMMKIFSNEKISIIFTCVYDVTHPENIKKIYKIAKKNKGKVYFVQLSPRKEELVKRVKGASRKKYGKVKSVKNLLEGLKKFDHYAQVPYKENFKIDNTKLSAKKTAQKIKEHYKL